VTSSAYTESTELGLETGDEVAWGGHTFELLDVVSERDARTEVVRANVALDGGKAYGPAFTTFLQTGQVVPTPSVRTGLTHDVYFTIAGTNPPIVGSDAVTIEVFKKPLILWMWIGGLLMAIGTVLAAFPGTRRRNPIDPVSARVPGPDLRETVVAGD
jgi:cytochrome c-type biogenesis protein CcmF